MRNFGRWSCGHWIAELEGVSRIRSLSYAREANFMRVQFVTWPECNDQPSSVHAQTLAINDIVLRAYKLLPSCVHIKRAVNRLHRSPSPSEYTGAVCDLLFNLPVSDRQLLLETEPLSARLAATLDRLHRQFDFVSMKNEHHLPVH